MPVTEITEHADLVQHLWNTPVAFHFEVSIGGETDMLQCSFTELRGLNATVHYETCSEAGYHNGDKKVLTGISYTNLVLKRGLLRGAALTKWFTTTITHSKITAKNIVIRLMDSSYNSVVVWKVLNAHPISIKISPLNSMKNELVVEEVELAYESFTREDTLVKA